MHLIVLFRQRQVAVHGVGSKTKKTILASPFEADRDISIQVENGRHICYDRSSNAGSHEAAKAVVQAVAFARIEVNVGFSSEPVSIDLK